MKRRITWITPDYFVDCDHHPDLWRGLLDSFEVRWIVVLPIDGARYKESDFDALRQLQGLTIEFIYCRYRQRDPRRFAFYRQLWVLIRQEPYDILYFNYVLSDPYGIPFFWTLNKRRTIFAAHDGMANSSFKAPLISRMIFHLTFPLIRHASLFSNTQAKLFRSYFPQSKVYIHPLALKSFGPAAALQSAQETRFLCFGVINSAKHIDLVIEAACNMYEKGYRNFSVSICGSCTNWAYYQKKIRYPELFNCQIRLIGNEEIPGLFGSHHFLVQPYRMLSQSGPLKIAFNYTLPVIASDLEGFRDELKEDVTGFFFRQGEVDALEHVLIKAIEMPADQYAALRNRMKDYVVENYSMEAISSGYHRMFEDVIEGKQQDCHD